MKKEEKDLASLMDELLEVLSEERDIYEELAPISEKKTQVLIKEDLKELKKITDKEQLLVDKVSIVDRKREKVIQNISVVLNKDSKELDLATLGNILCKQPDERKKLNMLHDSLRQVMNRLVIANQKNKEIIVFTGFVGDSIQSGESKIIISTYGQKLENAYSIEYEIIK